MIYSLNSSLRHSKQTINTSFPINIGLKGRRDICAEWLPFMYRTVYNSPEQHEMVRKNELELVLLTEFARSVHHEILEVVFPTTLHLKVGSILYFLEPV